MPHTLGVFCDWLAQTPFSGVLQTTQWVVPALQTVHILAIGAVLASTLMIALRMLGVLGNQQPVGTLWFMRVIGGALTILLLTGSLLISAEPRRSLGSPAFQLKMVLLVCVCTLLILYRGRLLRAAHAPASVSNGSSKALVFTSLLLWMGIIVAGRWIAYASGQ